MFRFQSVSFLCLVLLLLAEGCAHERVETKGLSSTWFSTQQCDISVPCHPCAQTNTVGKPPLVSLSM